MRVTPPAATTPDDATSAKWRQRWLGHGDQSKRIEHVSHRNFSVVE
jgi:hypothetical protein